MPAAGKKKSLRWLWVLLILLAVGVLFCGIAVLVIAKWGSISSYTGNVLSALLAKPISTPQIVKQTVVVTTIPESVAKVSPTEVGEAPRATLAPTLDKVDKLSTAVAQLAEVVVKQATVTVTESVSSLITSTVAIIGAIQYPPIVAPDPKRQPVFPYAPFAERPALAAYEEPFEDGDYFEAGFGDVDLPQYYYRIVTAGKIRISELGVDCTAEGNRGCALVIINHYGPTAMWRDVEVDNGFTVAGLVFDMENPEKVTLAAQALIDHVIYRMTVKPNPGANCSTIDGCPSVEWHVVIVGDGKPVAHWNGLFRR